MGLWLACEDKANKMVSTAQTSQELKAQAQACDKATKGSKSSALTLALNRTLWLSGRSSTRDACGCGSHAAGTTERLRGILKCSESRQEKLSKLIRISAVDLRVQTRFMIDCCRMKHMLAMPWM